MLNGSTQMLSWATAFFDIKTIKDRKTVNSALQQLLVQTVISTGYTNNIMVEGVCLYIGNFLLRWYAPFLTMGKALCNIYTPINNY